MANLNLSYTVVTAPYSGYMGRRTLEPGQYVSAGQTLSYIVRQSGKWITANYRETQIANIYIGQPVRIKVDGVPGRVFHGHVTAISEATGSKYSLVPTDKFGRKLREGAAAHTCAHRHRRRRRGEHEAAACRHDG